MPTERSWTHVTIYTSVEFANCLSPRVEFSIRVNGKRAHMRFYGTRDRKGYTLIEQEYRGTGHYTFCVLFYWESQILQHYCRIGGKQWRDHELMTGGQAHLELFCASWNIGGGLRLNTLNDRRLVSESDEGLGRKWGNGSSLEQGFIFRVSRNNVKVWVVAKGVKDTFISRYQGNCLWVIRNCFFHRSSISLLWLVFRDLWQALSFKALSNVPIFWVKTHTVPGDKLHINNALIMWQSSDWQVQVSTGLIREPVDMPQGAEGETCCKGKA